MDYGDHKYYFPDSHFILVYGSTNNSIVTNENKTNGIPTLTIYNFNQDTHKEALLTYESTHPIPSLENTLP